jgi:vitamin K-dependent gamma-carboxylase
MIKQLNRPIDMAILVYFRFFAGLLLAQELINGLTIGKFREYTAPYMSFNYLFFDWVSPWPSWGMAIHYAVTILAGFAVALGYKYRLSTIILFLGYTSLFLMNMSEYINHTYLYCLISFWLIWLPLGKDEIRSKAPAWMLYLVLFHMAIAYFFAGIAKLNSDWVMGKPMDIFLGSRGNHPLGGIYNHPYSPLFFSWGGILFDLLIVPALLWKRTRVMALISAFIFHISNVLMFGLATFPWFSLVLTTMFFDPSWPRRIPGFERYLLNQKNTETEGELKPFPTLLWGYIILHLLLPLRHHVMYPESPSWSEEGHMFSWRMMLRTKRGEVHFWVENKKTGKKRYVYAKGFLTQRQYNSMVGKPDLILQFAHFLRDRYKSKGEEVAVYASSKISLNGRAPQEIIRPEVDLAQEERSLWPYSWIMNLEDLHLAQD